MKLYVENILPIDPLATLELFDSDAFRERMNERGPVRSEVIESRREGDIEVRRLRMVGKEDLPAFVARVIGSKRLTYEQTNRLDRARLRLDWTVKVPATERFQCSGRTVMHPHPEGTRRVLEGVLEVSIPLVGGQIEKAIGPEFQKSLGRAAEVALELLREGRG